MTINVQVGRFPLAYCQTLLQDESFNEKTTPRVEQHCDQHWHEIGQCSAQSEHADTENFTSVDVLVIVWLHTWWYRILVGGEEYNGWDSSNKHMKYWIFSLFVSAIAWERGWVWIKTYNERGNENWLRVLSPEIATDWWIACVTLWNERYFSEF